VQEGPTEKTEILSRRVITTFGALRPPFRVFGAVAVLRVAGI
jgi:hypothetical protein